MPSQQKSLNIIQSFQWSYSVLLARSLYLSICSSVENFREKLAEIKGIPHFTNEATEEILAGYKSDRIHAKIINSALK